MDQSGLFFEKLTSCVWLDVHIFFRLLEDLGGSKQELGSLAHFMCDRSHSLPMAQSAKVRKQEIKKGL